VGECQPLHMGCVARHLRTAAPEHMVDNAGGHVALVATVRRCRLKPAPPKLKCA